MYKKSSIIFIYTETPLHPGSGTSLGVVDLTIQREKITDFPLIQASGIKGAIREWFELYSNEDQNKINIVFGPEMEGESHASAIGFTDARLLLFPVRSLKGIFAYTTCPTVLERLKRDLTIAGINTTTWSIPSISSEKDAIVNSESDILEGDNIVLEEFTFEKDKNVNNQNIKDISNWISNNAIPIDSGYNFWREKIKKSLVILPDNAFKDFVKFSTEVVARIKMKEDGSKVVKEGGLWYEENLPSETLLYSLVMATDPLVEENKRPNDLKNADAVLNFVKNNKLTRLQIGGNETIGRGIVSLRFYEGV